MAADGAATPSRKSRILESLEVLAKLVGASAVLVVALFANSLQGRLTGLSIQSQREQAESQLRANMFASLVAPLAGQKDGQAMSADREVLLTKLLAFNFNDSFDMKPLLEHAAKQLATETKKKNKDDDDPREDLWSVSRRIAERQRAAISREWSKYYDTQSSKLSPFAFFLSPWKTSAAPERGCEVYYVNFDSRRPQNGEPITTNTDCQISATFRDIIDMKSPDGHYILRTVAANPDWNDQTIKLTTQPFLSSQGNPKPTDTQYNFHMTWLDLPLTDNTLLSDGNRYAVYMRSFYNSFQTVSITVMWFPKGYFTPRERPLNYSEVQELMGRKSE